MGKLRRVFLTCLAVATCFLFSSPDLIAQAQSQLSTTISPVTFELSANPGEKLDNAVKVTNVSDQPISYKMEVESFTGNENGQATVVQNDPNPDLALKDWVKLSPSAFTLPSKQSQTINVIITIPKNAEPGGRYASILASTSGSSDLSGTGAHVGSKIGTLVLLSVRGDIKYQAEVTKFDADQKLFQHSPINFQTRIHNDSSVHIKPKGFVSIADTFGHKVADIPFDERNALPKSDRLIQTKYDKPLGIGKYTATLSLIYGEKNDQLISTTSFIVFPWKTGLPIIAGILIVLWYLVARRKRVVAALKIIFGRG